MLRKKIIYILIFFYSCLTVRAEGEVLDKIIQLPKLKGSTYEILNRITELSGMLFIYDSNSINNDRKISIEAGKMSLRQAIVKVVQEENIQMRVVERHILLYTEKKLTQEDSQLTRPKPLPPEQSFHTIRGVIRDKLTREPLPFASVSMPESGIGSMSNQDGQFLLKLPDSLQNTSIYISYLGYVPQLLPSRLFDENQVDILLETNIIPIQEVIISLVNPMKVIREMLDSREKNYRKTPVNMTVFYREGIDRKNSFVNLSEAVFEVNKAPYNSVEQDRVKMLKMRKISNTKEKDSIVLKMRAGVSSSTSLDIIKNLPDFFILDDNNLYDYTKIDMTEMDSRLAHVISFEQKKDNNKPLYKGEMYIDSENLALLNARFEIDPKFIKKAKDMYVIKQGKHTNITPSHINYTVSYKEWKGTYYISYIRGDLTFSISKKKKLFSTPSSIHSYFEMAVCKIDTLNVKRFSSKESIPTSNVFSDTHFVYDEHFWGDLNIIPPEEKLSKNISRIVAKIEENRE